MAGNIFGVDLGTRNLKVYSKGLGKVFNEKNAVAIVGKNRLYAYGDRAYDMYEKAPESIDIKFPINKGVIADYNFMQTMLYEFLEKHSKGRVHGAEFVVAVPTDITEVEKKAFFDIFYKSSLKSRLVLLCEKPIADAVGLGIDVNEPTGVMVVDFGADTTEISVISLGGLVLSTLLNFGGNRIDESIISYIKKNFNLVIGQKTAMQLKETLANGIGSNEDSMVVVGRNLLSGLPIEMEVTSETVYEAIKSDLASVCTSIKMILERTPPELAKDIIHDGIYITGGGSQIKDLDTLFTDITGIKVNQCEIPEECVVRGLVKIVSDEKYKRLAFSMKSRILK